MKLVCIDSHHGIDLSVTEVNLFLVVRGSLPPDTLNAFTARCLITNSEASLRKAQLHLTSCVASHFAVVLVTFLL